MYLENQKIILRDTKESDIDDIIYWNTVEKEWMLWDAPWIYEAEDKTDWAQYRINKRKQIQELKNHDDLRMRLELCINNEKQTHIGYVSAYYINDQFKIDDNGNHLAIGMNICAPKYRRKGYGSNAYALYIHYLMEHGIQTIYTQTYSGNQPMIKMAEKLGFKECNRFEKIRHVRGELYDGLTFVLKKQTADTNHRGAML